MNPYVRAAKKFPKLKAEAQQKLDDRNKGKKPADKSSKVKPSK